ncbi:MULTISPECIES: hypothetical protein [unclassified Microbacterium]|uniref:hypothetical protein n=1 Tax=unclassified Microbacterium TaxID=2609290 RepID=UPI0038656CC3
MRLLIALAAGITLAGLGHAYSRTRHCQRVLWHFATNDVRHSDPHLYGWGRG